LSRPTELEETFLFTNLLISRFTLFSPSYIHTPEYTFATKAIFHTARDLCFQVICRELYNLMCNPGVGRTKQGKTVANDGIGIEGICIARTIEISGSSCITLFGNV
jgi:hypothetical protein